MAITSQHVTGFVAGLGFSALTFYIYKKNQPKVDQFLSEHGIQMSSLVERDPQSMSLKELIKAKEGLEDMIAEREYEAKQSEKKKSTKD
jgi:translation initiation factor 2B subunit (eIF-2B alpha/beta/delta family)